MNNAQQEIKNLEEKVVELERTLRLNTEDYHRSVDSLKEDLDVKMQLKDHTIDMGIDEAKKESLKSLTEVQTKNEVLIKENEILTKSFENMGFDIKDMKGILNKLVDGVISKNQIKVIK